MTTLPYAKARFGPDRTIVWLASYPKSGSTWLRALLTCYLCPGEPLDLNALLGEPTVFDRSLLDDHAAIDSADCTPAQLVPYQAGWHREFARGGPQPLLMKTHSAFVRSSDGEALFPADASAGAVVIVRNPLDIVASYAHHEGKDFDQIIARMADEQAMQDHWRDRASKAVPQLLASWSTNVCTWLDQADIPVKLVRYEDLQHDPVSTLRGILAFCGFAPDHGELVAASDACRFERLQAHEAAAGFVEKPAAGRRFFRSGEAGKGASELSEGQRRQILTRHAATMQRLGYPVV